MHLRWTPTLDNKKLVILTLEGLATSALGCYGSSWNHTPNIDSVAAGGYVWDRWISPTGDSLDLLKRVLVDRKALAEFTDNGLTELVTDDSRVTQWNIDQAFDQVTLVDPAPVETAAEEFEDTAFARLIAATLERVENEPDVLWIHSRFLSKCWDAPRLPLAHEYPTESDEPIENEYLLSALEPTAESDAPPIVFPQTKPPEFQLGQYAHPDLVTSWMSTYGCQVRLVDMLVGLLLEELGSSFGDFEFVLTGTSGFGFGQNGWVGHSAGPLRSCHIRLPMILSSGGPLRVGHVTAADSLANVIQQRVLSKGDVVSPEAWVELCDDYSPRVETRTNRCRAITSPKWFLVKENDSLECLFLKPDDVNDTNDVSRLRPDIAEQLLAK